MKTSLYYRVNLVIKFYTGFYTGSGQSFQKKPSVGMDSMPTHIRYCQDGQQNLTTPQQAGRKAFNFPFQPAIIKEYLGTPVKQVSAPNNSWS